MPGKQVLSGASSEAILRCAETVGLGLNVARKLIFDE